MFVYVWVGLGFFLSLLTSSWDAMNMFFHANTLVYYFTSEIRDNLSTRDKTISPKVSLVWRFYCISIWNFNGMYMVN